MQARSVPSTTIHKRRLLYGVMLVSAASLLALYVTLFIGLLQKPALNGIDFLIFYTAGRIAQLGRLEQLYDLGLQHALQSPIVGPAFVEGGALPFNHPPLLVPLLGMIVSDDYTASFLRWSVILGLALAGCSFVAGRITWDHSHDLRQSGLVAVLVLLFYPVFISLLKGQDTAFVLLGALVWMWALLGGRERLAGVALALTLLKPQIGLVLGLAMLLARRRVWWWFCGTSSLLALYSLLLVGWRGGMDFIGLLTLSAQGEGFGMNQTAMFNFIGLMLRSAPNINPDMLRAAGWLVFVLGSAVLGLLWRSGPADADMQRIGLTVLISLFCSPHLHAHDLSLLTLPIMSLALLLRRDPEHWEAAPVILPLASLLMIMASGAWQYLIVYALMLALAGALWVKLRNEAHITT